jgi:beta-lactam-binding protein with PASTA domain
MMKVPAARGLQLKDAYSAIERCKLVIGKLKWRNDEKAPLNSVVSQNPEGGESSTASSPA